jgi:hypothetical protein
VPSPPFQIGVVDRTLTGDLKRWEKKDGKLFLDAAARGQKFVLDCDYYPEAIQWLTDLLKSNQSR